MPGSGVEAGASYGDLLVTSMLVLGAVCIAAFLAVRFFGRFVAGGRTRGAHLLEVVARVALEPRRSLYVVEVAGKTLLVGTSEMGLSVLSELDAAEVKTRAVPPQSFADLVRGAWSKRKGLAGDAGMRRDASTNEVLARTRADAGSKDVAAETRDRAGSDVSAETRASVGSASIAAKPPGGAASNGIAAEPPGGAGANDVSAETRGAVRADDAA